MAGTDGLATKRSRREFPTAQARAVIDRISSWDTLGMFRERLDPSTLPGYLDVIDSPIDLPTIRERVDAGRYRTVEDFEDDVAAMVGNALVYNDADTRWHRHAQRLKAKLGELLAALDEEADGDAAFIPSGEARDNERTLARAEQRVGEDLSATIAALEKDQDVPLEELLAKYRGPAAAKALEEAAAELGGEESIGSRSQQSLSEEGSNSSSSSSSSSADTGDDGAALESDEEDDDDDKVGSSSASSEKGSVVR